MILRSILLEDFGLYAGSNRLDLVPSRRKGRDCPIVLIGGKNGAGKTTLLEAFRLALYGRRALGARVAQSDYELYLRNAVHRGTGGDSAAVGIEFDYAEAGVVHRYRVRREWRAREKSVVETLHVDKDGSAITSVPREEWHQFLQELIPPGVSQLFFFDGEKIREIADEEQDNENLAEAVRGLLGIELVSRLRTDLGLFVARHQGGESPQAGESLDAVLREIAEVQKGVTDLSAQVAELTSQKDSQARAAEHVRRRFVSEGGDAAAQRARIEGERDELKRQAAQIEHELHGLANSLMPFAVAPRLVGAFQAALGQSGGGRDLANIKKLENALALWRSDKKSKRKAKWGAKHWNDLSHFLKDWSQSTDKRKKIAPALREIADGPAVLARLLEVTTVTRPRCVALARKLDEITARLTDSEASLLRADGAAAGLLLDELRLADQRLGATEASLAARQEELKTLRGRLVTLDRDRRRLLETQANTLASTGRLALAGKVSTALAEYETRLLDHKLAQLRTEFVRRFNTLARKAEFITNVEIDRETFATTLIDRSGHAVPKSSLSAGEKQIYAIAMLWALARTSQRPLPMIIDTPLARLDSEHRSNLVERYFPAASHQVVLLSTDTEVDVELMEALGDNVSHTYRLDYDPAEGRTIASHGYFGDLAKTERRLAL